MKGGGRRARDVAELETRGGRRFRPQYLLAALVAFVMGVAFTSTYVRREETVGDSLWGTVYGALAFAMWVTTAATLWLAFARPRS